MHSSPTGSSSCATRNSCATPRGPSRELIDYLDLPWDERCLEFYKNTRAVMSPSNIQIRHPVYKVAVDRWKRYEKHLEPLIEVVGAAQGEAVIR